MRFESLDYLYMPSRDVAADLAWFTGDRSVAEFPLTVGVIGTVFAPILAAAGALAAVLTECTIEVERAANGSRNEDAA